MKSLPRVLLALTLSSAGFVSSCSSPVATSAPIDVSSTRVLADIADNILIPMYADLDSSASKLDADMHAFADEPTELTLAMCRSDWHATRHAWERCYACAIGDLSTDNIATLLDPRPVSYPRIDSLLAGTDPIDPISAKQWEDDLRGLRAMEYVLFGTDGHRAVSSFAPRERTYLAVLAGDILDLSSRVSRSWDPAQSRSYYYDFVHAGTPGSTYSTARDAILDVAKALDAMCEDLITNDLDAALTNGPEYDPSPWADDAVAGFGERLRCAERIYVGNGASSTGLSRIVSLSDPTLDSLLRRDFNASITALLAIPTPYRVSIAQHDTHLETASQTIEALHSELATALIPLLEQEAH